jgi:putative acetyltransferase
VDGSRRRVAEAGAIAAPVVATVDESDVADVGALMLEYAASLGFDLCFQGFERELAELPGAYAPPRGALLIARAAGEAVGCVGLRSLGGSVCEMKRLYVRPGHRGSGTGRRLVHRLLEEARRMGYTTMRLDTLPGMESAQALYVGLGFREIPPYTANPVPGARFLELDLRT